MTSTTVPYQSGGAGAWLAGIKMLNEATRPIRRWFRWENLQRTAAVICAVSLVTAIAIDAAGPEIGIGLRVVSLAGGLYLGYSKISAWAGKNPNVFLVGIIGYAAHQGVWVFVENIDGEAVARTAVLWSGLVWGVLFLRPYAARRIKATLMKRR